MRLCSAIVGGVPTFGEIVGDRFFDLGRSLRNQMPDLRAFLRHLGTPDLRYDASRTPSVGVDQIEYLPLFPNRDLRVFGLGWAYAEHQAETGKAPPKHPFFFNKLPQSLVGSGRPIVKPSDRFDFEGEVVVVVGKPGRSIPEERAHEHVAGYSLMMDGSARDWQEHSVAAGKNFDASSSLGPCIATADEVRDPGAMEIVTRLNGVEMQRARFGQMAWPVSYLVSYISHFTALEVGDCISTGTPGGVGHKRQPPVFMKAGDEVSVEIEEIGRLVNPVVDASAEEMQ